MAGFRDRLHSKYSKHGPAHIVGRGIEWATLQSRMTAKLYWNIAPVMYRRKYGKDLKEYRNQPDPFQRRYINPEDIKLMSSRKTSTGVYDVGEVRSGNWDKNCPLVENSSVYSAIRQRYETGKPWKELPFIRSKLEQIRQGKRVWHGCTSKEDIFDRCEKLDKLFKTIQENGYKSQPELREDSPSPTDAFGFFNEYINEIAVDIGRDGEMLFLDGRHRLAMVHTIGIEQVPVAIIVRHKQWMEKRGNHFENSTIKSHLM